MVGGQWEDGRDYTRSLLAGCSEHFLGPISVVEAVTLPREEGTP